MVAIEAGQVAAAGQAGEVARRLAGRAGAGLLTALGVPLSRHTALRLLLRLPLPEVNVPRVLTDRKRRIKYVPSIWSGAPGSFRMQIVRFWRVARRNSMIGLWR
jgi:hypothetical protein